MVDIFGANITIPQFGIGSGKIIIALSILLIAIGIAIIIWLIYDRRVYNKKIIVFENISGQGYQPSLKDRARLIKLGDGGEEILYLKKKKVYRAAYGRKMGKNTYWFAVGQDGYWYNSVLGDVDAKMGMLDIEPIDRDMRYMHVAIRKNIQDRYRKQSWMEKYGVIMIIGIWFLLDKIAEIAGTTASNIETARALQEANQQILSGLDNIKGSSGFIRT
jgi:hypothetical protein